MLDPPLLTAGLQVVALGVPPDALIDGPAPGQRARPGDRPAPTCRCSSTAASRRSLDAGAPPEQLERVQATVARLQPAAAQALLAAFRTEMAAAVEETIER